MYSARIWIVLCFALGCCGCTHTALRDNTAATAGTLTDLQYRMVLDNIAMFHENPDALPWHVKLTQGTMSVSDQLNPSFAYGWPSVSRTLTFSGSRNWTDGWTVVPVIDKPELNVLRGIYRAESKKNWFEVGKVVPRGCPAGHYGLTWVWVKPDHLGDLTEVTLNVLEATPVKAEERALILPGPQPIPR